MNAGFSYFHQICDQIQDIFHNKWDRVSAMGTSNCSNICDFGKQSIATAKYARQGPSLSIGNCLTSVFCFHSTMAPKALQ